MKYDTVKNIKKIIGAIVLSALLFLQIGVSAAGDISKGDFTITNADNTVTVNGATATGEKNTEVSIMVTTPNVNRTEVAVDNISDTVVYADQIKTDVGGVYSYNFKLGEEYGKYTVHIYDSSNQTIKSKDVVYQKPSIIRPKGIEVKFTDLSDKEIYYLTSDTQKLKVGVKITADNELDLSGDKTLSFIAAAYKDDILTYADVISTGVGEKAKEINTSNADTVKVFGFDSLENLSPVMTEYAIMQSDKLLPNQIIFDGKNRIGTTSGVTDTDGVYLIGGTSTGEFLLDDSLEHTASDGAVISFDFMTETDNTSAYLSLINEKEDGTECKTNSLIIRNKRTDVDGDVIDPVLQVFKKSYGDAKLDDTFVYGKNQSGTDYMYRDYGVDLLEKDTQISDKADKISYKQLLHKKIGIIPQKWHHIDICIDYAYGSENGYGEDGTYGRSFVYYYMDGELLKQAEYWDYYNTPGDMRYSQNPSWAIQDIPMGLNKLKAVKVTNRGTGGALSLKDVKIRKIKNYGETLNFDNNLEYPYYFDKWINLKNSQIGSSFVGKNINYTAEITNPYLTNGTFTYSLSVVNQDTGKTEQTISDTFNLAKGETKSVPIAFTAERYGKYKITGTATDNLTGRKINIDKDFAVSVKNQSLNPKIMFCDHMTVHYMGTHDAKARLKQLADIGVSGIREDQPYLSGSSINTGAKYVFDNTESNGMNRIVLLTGDLWNSGINTDAKLEEFKTNITKVINATKGYNVDYEVYNEYNLHEDDASYTPDAYVKVLKTAYETVQKLAPGAKVYGIGSSTNMWNGEVSRPSYFTFTEECLRLGAAHYCDGFVLHPYGGGGTSAAQMYDKMINPIINTYKNTKCGCSTCTAAGKNTYNIDDKEVIITETGYSSKDDKYQTALTLGFLNLLGDEVDRTALYVDMMKEGSTESENHFGMIRSNHLQFNYPNEPYSPRESVIALAAFNDLSRGTSGKVISKALNDEDLKLTKSKYENGDTLISFFDTKISGNGDASVLANRNKKATLKLSGVDNGAVYLYDAYGNETKYTVNTGEIFIDVTFDSVPQYVKGKFSGITVVSR